MLDFLASWISSLSPTMRWILLIICVAVGFFALIKGADVFVDCSSNFAKLMKIPPLIVGLTIVAFGTSAPEASISISAILSGSNGISIGNIVGSNIFNLLLILGLSASLVTIAIEKKVVKRDLTFMLIASFSLLISIFIFNFNENQAIIWVEGIFLLLLLVFYITILIITEKKEQKEKQKKTQIDSKVFAEKNIQEPKINLTKTIVFFFISLAAIVLGGELVNVGAKGIVMELGASETLAGLTICAVGTSLPELITSLVSIKKGENEIALGNIIGSNLFNILFVLGICSVLTPLTFNSFAIRDVIIMNAIFVLFFLYCLFHKKITKRAGVAMVWVYALFFIYIILREYTFLF